ncbi:MAG: hypothetical protein KAJ55_06690 [Anaerolineales bacterium]|nr:hypothetical protein [Anaerolineales bacterium]
MLPDVLDTIERRIEVVDGTLLSVVEDPFRFPTYYHSVYMAKTEKRAFTGSDKITGGRLSILELDGWVTGILNGSMNAIWPIAPESIVNTLYRDKSFNDIALHAEKCITARFFDPDKFSPWSLQPILNEARRSGVSLKKLQSLQPLVKEHFMRYGTAIHYLRTGDLETDYNVLKGHFYIGELNVVELTKERKSSWTEEIAEKIRELHSELKGAVVCTAIDWGADMSDLLDLGLLVMQLRTVE